MHTFALAHCADSFRVLRELNAGAFDHVITDPPYDAHTQGNLIHGTAVKKWVGAGGGGSVPKRELSFAPLDSYEFTKDLARIAKGWALTFCAVEAFGPIRDLNGKAYRRGAIWYKPNAQGQMTGDRPACAYEGIACLHTETHKPAWNGRGSFGLWVCNSTRGKKNRHPNEKPLELCLKLVALFTNRGDSILDPFCGSSAIGEACILLGRTYVGLDSDAAWIAASETRLASIPFGVVTDADALTLCTAKRDEICE